MSESIKMSTGVVFKIKDVPVVAVDAIKQKASKDRPKAPRQWIENKEREETNYDDPEYKASLKEWDERLILALYDGFIMLGTDIESIPEGFPRPEDNWDEDFQVLGIEMHKDGKARYLDWVKYCAARNADDMEDLIIACGRSAGVREEDVRQASETFRNNEERGAD